METAPPLYGSAGNEIPKDAKTMAMLAHLLCAFFGFLPALIIWLIKKDEHPFIADQAKEALNFQITLVIAAICAVILAVITFGFGAILFPVIGICNLVFCILGGLKANEGVSYRYPVALRLIK